MSHAGIDEQPYLPPTEIESGSQQRATHVRVQVSVMLCLAATTAYICRNSLVACPEIIRKDLRLSEYEMGIILGPAFFWSYALAQIPGGWLGERFGSRRCLPLFSFVWSAAFAALAVAFGFPLLLTSRVVGGLAQAGLFPCCTKTISHWHPPTERALSSGALTAFQSIGGAIGAFFVGVLIVWMSWRWIFILYSLPGLLWALVFFVWFREYPSQHTGVNAAELKTITPDPKYVLHSVHTGPRTKIDVWLALFTSPAAWLIFIQQFFRAAGYAFFSSWFAVYLQKSRGISTKQAAILTTLPLIVVAVSSLFAGGVSDYIYKRTGSLAFSRKGLSAISQFACAAIMYSAYFVTDANLAVIVISVGVFCSGFAGPLSYALTIDMGGRNVSPFFSTMNMMGNIGAGLLPMGVPWFKYWIEQTPALYSLSDHNSWNAVLVLFAVMYLLSSICWMLLRTHADVYQQSWLVRWKQRLTTRSEIH